MVAIPLVLDPTLEASDRMMEQMAWSEPKRGYLGASAIGGACERRLWLDYNAKSVTRFPASTLKKFDDGHRSEDIQAERLRLVEGVHLWTVDPMTGKQFAIQDHDGKFRGHADGVILGLLQCPQTVHTWEHKCVNEKKFQKLNQLKAELGEKSALAAWDTVYHVQAMIYCHYLEIDRHYLTVSTPGTRDVTSCRTNYDKDVALVAIAKAKRIIEAKVPLAPISTNPSFFMCKMCDHREFCHGNNAA